jgi:hypothetical protein
MAGPDPKRLHLRIARAGRPCVFDVGERGALRNMIPFLARPETDPGSFALPVSQPCDMGGRDGISFPEKAMLPLAALPCRIGQWPTGLSIATLAVSLAPFPPFPRSPSVPNETRPQG